MRLDQQLSDKQQIDLTRAVMRYLDTWKLSAQQIMAILNLSESVKTRHLSHFRGGTKAFPNEKDIWICVDHIIGICDALRTTFPFSEEMRLSWIRKPHRRFNRQTPLEVMLNEGTSGLLKVRIDIDCAFGWKISESMADQAKSEAGK